MKNTRNNRNAAIFSAKLFALVIIVTLMSQTIAIGQAITSDVFMSGAVLVTATPQRMFYARNYGGKCLDFGAPPQVTGGPVYLYGCNGTIAQQLRIVEINERHEVRLYAGNKVVGVKDNGEKDNGFSATRYSGKEISLELQLQNEADLNTIFARNQIFALDGDSIIWVANRSLVVKVQNARGANRTPLVLSTRNFSDEEFWDITATDGSAARPTTGFERVTQANDFVNKLNQATWGKVIEVGASFDLRNSPTLYIPAGVTIRGDRRRTNLGPELLGDETMFEIKGDYARITGLRLRGPSRSTDADVSGFGIQVRENLYQGVTIDHNDISDWPVAAVDVRGDADLAVCDADTNGNPHVRPHRTRVLYNFIHHNQKQNKGYGVLVSYGSFPLIGGNTFVSNRHAIASDGRATSGYRAYYNLVLSTVPEQEFAYIGLWKSHDFDMHGRGDNGFGGVGGQYVDIGWNTFLGTKGRLDRWHENFDLRGEPCLLAEFHHNISLQEQADAVACSDCGNRNKLKIFDNQFSSANPTRRLGVGDFDGDGREDLFLTTGAAWYYAPAGNAEWRMLSTHSDSINSLRFGDFDNDGRTDVFAQHGNNWDVSWGGISKWETINGSGPLLQDFTIGDFVGDRRADVFYADGQTWYISDGGVGPFTAINTSSFRVAALRFGDFNADGKTDVFSVVSGNWMVSYSGTSAWTYLRSKLTDSVSSLTVADFNGDGRADLATISLIGSTTLAWKVSYSGVGGWVTLRTDGLPTPSIAAIGRFDGNRSADMLRWHGNFLDIAAGGSGAAQRQSRQDMR